MASLLYTPLVTFLMYMIIASCIVSTLSSDCSDCNPTETSPPLDINESVDTVSNKENVATTSKERYTDDYSTQTPSISQKSIVELEEPQILPPPELQQPPPIWIEAQPNIVMPPPNTGSNLKDILVFHNPETGETEISYTYPIWMRQYLLVCPSAYTCDDSCGERMTPGHNFRKCSCDKMCRYFSDCCQDYFSKCESLDSDQQVEGFINSIPSFSAENSILENNEYSDITLAKYGVCEKVEYYLKDDVTATFTYIWVVHKCPDQIYIEGSMEHDFQQACEKGPQHSLFSYPVSHRWIPKLVYKNIYCAFCHGLKMEDISVWNVQIHCDDLGRKSDGWSVNQIIDLLEGDSHCSSSMGPEIVTLEPFRSCSGMMIKSDRCSNRNESHVSVRENDSPTQSMDEKLCHSYFRPFVFNQTQYANIHCLACEDQDLALTEEVAETMCPLWFSDGRASLNTKYMAVVSFKYGQFSVYTKDKDTGIQSQVRKSIRHENCSGTQFGADARQDFMEACLQALSCDEGKPPREVMLPHELPCSISQHRVSGKHVINQSLLDAYLIHINITIADRTQSEHLRILSNNIEQVFTSARMNDHNADDKFELQVINFPQSSNETSIFLRILWKTADKPVYALRQAALIDQKLRAAFVTYANNSNQKERPVNSFVLTNAITTQLSCEIGDIQEFTNVRVVLYHYQTLIVVENSPCYLDLDRLPFTITYTGSGKAPTSIDSVFMCPTPDAILKCGSIFIATDSHSPTGLNPKRKSESNTPEDGDKSGLMRPTEKPGPVGTFHGVGTRETEKVREDLDIFRNICFSVCLLGNLVNIVNILGALVSGTYTDKTTLILEITAFISNVIMVLLISLFLVSYEVQRLDGFVMGISSHFCWLLLSGITLIRAFNRNTSYGIMKGVSQVVVLIVVADIIVCSILDRTESINITIGYSHETKHLFWISDEIGCSIALVTACNVSFSVSFCIKMMTYYRHKDIKDDNTDVEETRAFRNKLSINGSSFDMRKTESFVVLLFLISVIDYYQKQNDLWPLLFNLVLFCMGVWQLLSFKTVWKECCRKK